jgi:integrase
MAVKTQNKPSEVRAKESVLRNHLVPFFGSKNIKDINSQDVDRYKALKVKEGQGAKSINNHLFILQRCLNVGMEWERIEKVPKIAKLKCVSQRLDFLSPTESRKLIQGCKEPMWREMLLMALRTGMRLGELCGLEWRDIDLQRKIITVQRSLVRGVLGTTKNNKVRHIPLSEDLCRSLCERRHEHGAVFRRPDGRPVVDWVAECGIRRACQQAGIRQITWHTLRHTFASQLVTEGVPINVVQTLLGHSTVVMTMKYAHLAPSALHEAVSVLERAEMREVAKE